MTGGVYSRSRKVSAWQVKSTKCVSTAARPGEREPYDALRSTNSVFATELCCSRKKLFLSIQLAPPGVAASNI